MNKKINLISTIMISAIATLVLYIFLHEFGHAIVILACGGRITEFSIFTAHVSSVGGAYTDAAALWMNVNGCVFPLICSYTYMLLYRREIRNKGYRIVSFLIVIFPTAGLLAWVFIPVLYINGGAPAGDDCTRFLEILAKSHSPLWVTFCALLLMGLGITLMLKKRIITNYVEVTKQQKTIDKVEQVKEYRNNSILVCDERRMADMKKRITIITCIIAGLLVLIGGTLLFLRKDMGAKTNEIRFGEMVTVSNGVAEPTMSQLPIQVEKSSSYSFLLEWEAKQPGLLSGINIVNEQGESVFACTGESARIETLVQYLTAGEYTLEIHYLTSEEAFDAFYERVGSEPEYSDGEWEYDYAENGQWEIDYVISTFDTAAEGDGMAYALIVGVIIGLLLVVIIMAATKTDDNIKCNFDERQELVRGKGFKYGFFTMLICNGIFAVLKLLEVALFAEAEVPMFFSMLVGVAVFACYCIWNDGYFSLNENRRSLMIVFAVVGIVNVALGVINICRGEFLVNGSLTFHSLNFFCGILSAVIFVALLFKKIKDGRDE